MKNLRDEIALELDLIKSCNTIGGGLTYFKALFEKIQAIPQAKQVILQIKKQIEEEDQKTFENHQKAVEWYHCKLIRLSKYLRSGGYLEHYISDLVKFNVLELGSGGYLRALFLNLEQAASEALRSKDSFPIFEGWAIIDQLNSGEYFIREFILPDYIEQERNKLSLENEIFQWEKNADISLSVLFRFLTILSLYGTFVPLTFNPDSSSYTPPKNLQDLEEIQNRAHIGYFLSLFDSPNMKEHPLSLAELVKLIERFILLLESAIQFSQSNLQTKILPSSKSHWRTEQKNADVEALLPFAKDIWKKEISEGIRPMRLSPEKMAEKFVYSLPKSIFLFCNGKKRIPRLKAALKKTDPRLYDENGAYIDLKPHWDQFK